MNQGRPPGRCIVAGVPTWNEAEVIAAHTQRIDLALRRHFRADRTLIVNADNSSPDGTSAVFLNTPSATPKRAEVSAQRGKGFNFRLLFATALEEKADVLITLDADLEELPDDWLPCLAEPVLTGRADLVLPLYPRFWYDGNLTNQVMAPLMSAVTGVPVRQPMGGEFAFSRAALELLISFDWPAAAFRFGVDLFCVARLLRAGVSIYQAPLSTGKIHSWRSNTSSELAEEMDHKFHSMIKALTDELATWALPRTSAALRFPEGPELQRRPKDYNPAHIVETAQTEHRHRRKDHEYVFLLGRENLDSERLPILGDEDWAAVLARVIHLRRRGELSDQFIQSFRALFYVRIARVLPALRQSDVEPMVQRVTNALRRELHNLPRDIDAPGLESPPNGHAR